MANASLSFPFALSKFPVWESKATAKSPTVAFGGNLATPCTSLRTSSGILAEHSIARTARR